MPISSHTVPLRALFARCQNRPGISPACFGFHRYSSFSAPITSSSSRAVETVAFCFRLLLKRPVSSSLQYFFCKWSPYRRRCPTAIRCRMAAVFLRAGAGFHQIRLRRGFHPRLCKRDELAGWIPSLCRRSILDIISCGFFLSRAVQ